MASLLDKVKAAVDSGTLKPANYNDAIFASRNDPEVRAYLESITPSSPVALFDTAAKGSGYPRLRDRTSPLGSIARVATGETPIFNPYLFNGVTRPTSEATKQVDMQNRNATIQKQNQAMVNAAQALGGIFSGGGRTAENTAGTTNTTGAGLASLLPMIQGRPPSMVGQGIQSTVEPDESILSNLLPLLKGRAPSYVVGGSLGVQETRDLGIAENQIKSQESISKDKLDIIDELKKGTITASAGQRKLDVVQERQDRLDRGVKSQGNKSIKFDEDRKKLLEDLGEDATEVQKRIDNPNAPIVPTTELPEEINTDATVTVGDGTSPEGAEDLTPEAKTFNTAATVVSPEGAEDKQNWFDAVNDRVDLMAMGAAMLAGSGQRGATTMSRLGQGLQAGLASRAAQAKAAEDKQYTDALLVLKAMEQRRLSAKDRSIPALSYANQVDSLESLIRNQGGEGENVSDLARNILIRDPQFGLRTPQEQVKAVRDAVKATSGLIYGGDVDPAKFSVVPPQQVAK